MPGGRLQQVMLRLEIQGWRNRFSNDSLDLNDSSYLHCAVDPTAAGSCRHDVDLKPVIRLDTIHKTISG